MKRSRLNPISRKRRSSLEAAGKGLYTLKRSPLKRKPARRIAKRAAFKPYLAFVAQRECAGIGFPGHVCDGPIQVMHVGRKPGLALKCADNETVAGCRAFHEDHDQYKGVFAGWTKQERRDWADREITLTRRAAWLAGVIGGAP